MATPVSICSNALLKLGARTISSFTDGTDMSTLCSNIYPEARDSLLRSHIWNFAVKRVELAADATAPAFGYANQHTLPGDFLRLVEVVDETDYKLEGRKILCESTPVQTKYIYRNDDTATYDSLFVELLTQKMVAELAYSVTRSDSKAQTEMQKFAAMLKQAKGIDAQEDPQPQFATSELLLSREQGYA